MKPKLRFKEFNDEWNEYVLQSESDVRDGTHDSPKYVDSGYPLITSKNLTDMGTLDFSNVSYLKQEDFDKINQRSKVDIGDILFGMIGTIGKPVKIDRDDFAIKNVALIKEKGLIKNDYLIHYLHSPNINKQFANNQDGGTQKFIALDKIRKLKINMPSRNEQIKIVSLFDLLDKKIELQTKKIEDLKLFKKGLSNNIFNNLKDFEEYKLGDLCNITTGKLDANAMVENGKYRFYTCAKEYSFIDEYSFDTEALLISGNGAYVGYIHYYNGKFNAYQRTYVLDQFSQNIQFIKCYLDENLSRRIKSEKKEGNTPYIVLSTLSDMIIKVPSKENQKNISNIINYHQRKILLEENKLQKLQELKKGLMQNMFV